MTDKPKTEDVKADDAKSAKKKMSADERLDALVDLMKANGISIPKELEG
jgi:hypothetical protein